MTTLDVLPLAPQAMPARSPFGDMARDGEDAPESFDAMIGRKLAQAKDTPDEESDSSPQLPARKPADKAKPDAADASPQTAQSAAEMLLKPEDAVCAIVKTTAVHVAGGAP